MARLSTGILVHKSAPGPRGYPIVGNLPRLWRNPLGFLVKAAHDYGDVVFFRIGMLDVYLLSHPDYIRHVLQDHCRNYRKTTRYEIVRPVFGDGLSISEGETWRRQRRLTQPAFHSQRLPALAATMTGATARMLESWQVSAARGQALDVAAEMTRLTLDIVTRTLFSTDIGEGAGAVGQALTILLERGSKRLWALSDLPYRLPTPGKIQCDQALQTLDRIVYGIIDERRRSARDTGDLLSMLLMVRDEETGEGMNDKQLRDEVMGLMLAGHETTANALAWCWYLVSQHPDVGQRLAAELAAVLAGRLPTFQDLSHLDYTRRVIEEAMRLYPPIWVYGRSAIEDDTIGGYRIPAGSTVLLSPYIMHRHRTYWKDPDLFDPERFTPDAMTGRPHYAYFPFGGGPRICIGYSFAMMEAQLIVATVAQAYRLRLVPGHRIEPQPVVTLRPRFGVRMALERISQ